MEKCIHCIHCGTAIHDGDFGYYLGVGGAYSTYCIHCRDEFLTSIRSRIDNEYGFDDYLNNAIYQYDDHSEIYYDLDAFISAEANRLADAYLNQVDLYEPGDDWPIWGYPNQIPAWSY